MDCQKQRFSLPSGEHYLNCAYMAPLSRRVVEAGIEGVSRKATPWRIVARDFFDEVDRARGLFARLIRAPDPRQVAIVPSVSYGFAQVARNTTLERGHNVVTLAEEFPSNAYVWQRLTRDTGAELRVVRRPADALERGEAWTEAVEAAIDERTRLVAVARVHWTDGTLFDLERIGARARSVGAALLVDGSQSIGAEPFDVRRIRPDALVVPAYKWLTGPYSIGCAWFSERYLEGRPIEESWMTREGSDDFARLVDGADRYRPGAARFDVGETSNFVLMPMLIAALEQILEWGPAPIQAYARSLTAGFVAAAREAGFTVAAEPWRAGHLFGLRLPGGSDPEALRQRLADAHVWVSVRGTAVRVSPHVYNDAADVAALTATLFESR